MFHAPFTDRQWVQYSKLTDSKQELPNYISLCHTMKNNGAAKAEDCKQGWQKKM